jgi:MscS family membrane protein
LPLINRCFRWVIVAVAVLTIIDSLGYSVGGIFATLGIGGALVALAAKDSIGNILSSLSIVLDRPFKVGDWVCVGEGEAEGNVEQIGLRSTRIRTFGKTLMVVPNSIMASSIINNYSSMPSRRVKQILYVDPSADPTVLREFIDGIGALLRGDGEIANELAFCSLCEFDAAALQIMVYYFTVATDLESHMGVRNRINQKILELANRLNVTPSAAYAIRTFPGEEKWEHFPAHREKSFRD